MQQDTLSGAGLTQFAPKCSLCNDQTKEQILYLSMRWKDPPVTNEQACAL